ncbi:MAG TPA: SulP family inorganic anion transporter [Pseudomonadales bacterium]|nr:SulP family inorganic anion transporter [Pseudomonadales bacterium]
MQAQPTQGSLTLKALAGLLDPATLRGDLYGGMTAAVVALPLALAFGVSSGAGPVAGLYSAILVGFFAALCGGTPTQVSGPTGPMTVVMATLISGQLALDPEHGLASAFAVVSLAGLFQIAFGVLRLGRYFVQVSYPVISGFMTGIGVIIIALQLGPLAGLPGASTAAGGLADLPRLASEGLPAAAALGLGTLALLFAWRGRVAELVPSPLLALVVGTGLVFALPDTFAIPLIGPIPSGLPTPGLPELGSLDLRTLVTSALLLATLGSIDTLLTSLVADNITRTQHVTDRELIGQGIGNTIAGLFGGLPGAGATMRTVVNVRAGGRTPLSGMTHALILLAVVLGAGGLASHIPLAVLAGILLKVGIDIIDWRFLRRLHRLPATSAGLMLGVLGLTVFVDLVTAVVIGVFVANMITIDRLTDVQLDGVKLDDETDPDGETDVTRPTHAGRTLILTLQGPMSFAVARGIRQRLGAFRRHETLIIDLSSAVLVGITTAMVVEDLIEAEQRQGHEVLLVGLKRPEMLRNFARLGILDRVAETARFTTLDAALQRSRRTAEGTGP